MFCNLVTYVFLIGIASCDGSFTIVIDTTNSMQEELDVIKANLGPVLYAVSNRTNIDSYIIVPFNDDIQEPLLKRTPKDLLTWLNTVSVRGGHECPENSLAGIEKALSISGPHSQIFVFSDAYSKDPHRLGSIQNLCKTTDSRVIIFLSGRCLPSPTSNSGNVDVYYDVASACSGAVLRFEPSHLRQAFKSMAGLTEVEWTDVKNYGPFENNKQFSFTVDAFTKNIMIAVSGEAPIIEITNADGQSQQTEKLVKSRYTQILRVSEKDIGDKTVSIRCGGLTSATSFIRRVSPVQYGFSTKPPRDFRETTGSPIPGMTNYILIYLTQDTLKLRTVEIQVMDAEKRPLDVEENNGTGLYTSKFYFEPNKSFRIWIKCYDTLNYNEVTVPTRYLSPQKAVSDSRWIQPTSEIIELSSITVKYGSSRIVSCKVNGYPKPNIWWEDNKGQILPSEHVLLEIPSVYISYVTMANVTENSTLHCKSHNSEGEHSQSVDVFVYRPYSFVIMQTPSDKIIEYGAEGTLACKVAAYPEAEIKWYYNDDLLTQANNLQVIVEDDSVRITNMSLNNVGDYKCQITNEVNDVTYKAHISISGIEKPKIETDDSKTVLKLGDHAYLQCRVTKGKPTPTITWQYKTMNDFDFGDTPDGVETDDIQLEITSVKNTHKGVYKCEATNVEGTDSAEIEVTLQYPPIIANKSAQSIVVREGATVALECDVRGSPTPRVRWELRRGGMRLPLDTAHTHRLNALWNNSGDYHCIAENELGMDEKTFTVKVLVPVYIEPPKSQKMVLRTGASVVLNCNVLYGDPVPSIKWKFIATDFTTTVISSGSSTVELINVTRANEGSYLCVAENEDSTDHIKIDVKVE